MNTEQEEEPVIMLESRAPTERELFYLEWGKELIKNQFNLYNEILKQIIATCIALMSVSVIFEALFGSDVKLKFFAVLMFFIALIVSCVGLFPYSRKDVFFDSPGDIERFKTDALHFKRLCYSVSAVFILFGLGIILYKVFVQAFV